ncbi:hypothetical protein K8O68_06395 [Salipaludibacillus sp. CUR1]|uniref:hypothetical protein n=1 Tax=Salipaludibacillus sp. CUR1 TaxID=2820003 RepID=UPI001E5C272E|nr:hypothetical protein [Salipaludibacillus sp. CUR1]MCE7792050.1 hypothetical protein [Salipaludibacillus sp. CUR1]
MKKFIIAVSVFVITWISISFFQTPVLHGQTEGKKWTASYTVSHSLKNLWEGELKWKEKQGFINQINLLIDGEQSTSIDGDAPIDMSEKKSYTYTAVSTEPQSSSRYELLVEWENDGNTHEELIQLEPKKRLFVIPKLD